MKKVLFLTLLFSFNLFAASDPLAMVGSLQYEDFKLTSFVKGEKEFLNECYFESESYEFQIDYCSKKLDLAAVKKGIIVNKVTGERLAIYLDDKDNDRKITNNISFQLYHSSTDGMNYSDKYTRAFYNSYGSDMSREVWKTSVDSLKGSAEMQYFIDLMFDLIEAQTP